MFDSRSTCPHGRAILSTSLHRQAFLMYHKPTWPSINHANRSHIKTHLLLVQHDKDIEEYIRECTYCQRCKTLNRVANTPIQVYGTSKHLFDSIHIELTSCKLNQTRNGNEYTMVVKCALTRWAEFIVRDNGSTISIRPNNMLILEYLSESLQTKEQNSSIRQ